MYRVSYEYVQVCVSYTSSFLMCSRGRRRASVPRPGPSLSGVLTAAGSNVCANFQEYLTMLSPPKMPGQSKKKKKKKKNPNENNRALCLSGLGPKYSCKQRWRAQAECKRHTGGIRKTVPSGHMPYSNPLAVLI